MTLVTNRSSLDAEKCYPKCLYKTQPQSNDINTLLSKKISNRKPRKSWTKDKDFPTHLMDGAYFPLIHLPFSDNAKAMVDVMAVQVAKAAGRTYKPTQPFKAALGALIHDLLELEGRERDHYGYRQMKPECFTGTHTPYRGYTDCIYGLHSAGFTFHEEGDPDWEGGNPFSTRTKARATLLAYAAGYGITPANLTDHFEHLPPVAAIRDPIVLKTAKTYTKKRVRKGKQLKKGKGIRKGVRMRFDKENPTAVRYGEQVNFLNAYWTRHTITNATHYAFQRVFARGDIDGAAFDKGGRLYGIGGSTLQGMPADERKAILFNGEPTVEVDVKASHITILHQLTNTPMPNRPDLYDFGDFPRAVIKSFITATLGHGTFHTDWPEEAVKIAKKKSEGKLNLKDYDFTAVKEATLIAIPLLKDWPDSHIRWGDLQFRESEPMIAAAIELAEVYDIPAYPVHDSLRVPISKVDIVKEVMRKQFIHYLGFEPILEVKD